MDKKSEENEKTCRECGKMLFDEKIPLCARCRIQCKEVIVRNVGLGAIRMIPAIVVGVSKARNKDNE